jgi:hypothetical protein
VTIGTVGDHNLPSTVTSNTYTVAFALEERDGCGLSETNNNADRVFIQTVKLLLLLLLPCGNIKVEQSSTGCQILL